MNIPSESQSAATSVADDHEDFEEVEMDVEAQLVKPLENKGQESPKSRESTRNVALESDCPIMKPEGELASLSWKYEAFEKGSDFESGEGWVSCFP